MVIIVFYRDIEGKQSKKVKKTIADINFSLSFITKFLSESNKNIYAASLTYMNECIEHYRELYGEESDEFLAKYDLLKELFSDSEMRDTRIEHEYHNN